MAKFIRYSLATVCFTASVACLALWWDTIANELHWIAMYVSPSFHLQLRAAAGTGNVELRRRILPGDNLLGEWHVQNSAFRGRANQLPWTGGQQGAFGRTRTGVYFPLWYPALAFAIAGVGVLRFRRQFSMRSALIAVSVVAALLGMVVAL
jgi:hypothetical protein